jgi:uncharacterized protein YqfB (UPF0267 family)
MGIDVSWVTENREPKQQVFDPRQLLTRLASDSWYDLPNSVCLRFIDPWGNTLFNQAQVPVLLAELQEAHAQQSDAELKAHLGKVIRLLEQANGRTHTYIQFTGD